MYRALYRKYRPQGFESVVGQNTIVKTLQNSIKNKSFSHAYMFFGPRGVGKTTASKIFARSINCLEPVDGNACGKCKSCVYSFEKECVDIIEIDAASNNGVENVRQIIHDAQERSIDSKYKIYIIDECHSLTNQAWQAFLKCIEEPPTYTIFIFCTTDPQKIPETIKNRVQRFTFNRIGTEQIKDRLSYICRQEGFTNYEESVDYLSKLCEGGMRAGITYLDKCSSYSTDLNINNVLSALGNYSYQTFFDLINNMIDGNEANVLDIISKYYDEGNDLKLLVDQFLNFCMDVTKYSLFRSPDVTRIPLSMENQLAGATNFDNASKYYTYVIDKLLVLKNMLKNDSSPRSTIEILFLQITRCA